MYLPLDRVLLRAPLLPVAALGRGRALKALGAHPLGAAAVLVASPSLSRAKPGAARERALERYARRAAFRPTPSGLWAGVCLGSLGGRTELATGAPAPYLGPSWARIDAAARALLDEPEVRERVRLRLSPSACLGPGRLRWIGPAEALAETHEASLDDRLAALVRVAGVWTPWPEVRAAARAPGEADGDVDELLRVLIDDRLLESDLGPALLGPPAADQLAARLRDLGRDAELGTLERARAALGAGEVAAGRAALDALPGAAERDLHAVLVHRPRRPPRLERAVVARAARLVPLLLRLQEALAPPAAERFASAALADALDAASESFGAGAFDLAALDAGDYGVDLDDPDDDPDDDPPAPAAAGAPPALLALLADAVVEAARQRTIEAALAPAALTAALGDLEATPCPPTAELFLTPATRRRGRRAGDGWLLGLHAPAGASLGRFIHALGGPGIDAGAEIAAAERRAAPAEERVDLAFSPSPELADLCAHPPIRQRALALTRSTGAGQDRNDDLMPRDLELFADPAVPEALALRERTTGAAIVPSPLWRVRSATAPAGLPRLLVGWSLFRQHAPWAFSPGPLGEWAFLPRLTLDGFVIAPASWRVPPAIRDGAAGRAALERWRRAAGLPATVQAGEGDRLTPIDLAAPGAPDELRGQARVFEIWPPPDRLPDRDGRRVEAVVAVFDDAPRPAAAPTATFAVPPPRAAPPETGWSTYRLYGAAARQDELLAGTVAPVVHAGQQAREIDAWFFLRYVDGPGRRPHLRLRVHAAAFPTAFERRLRTALGSARAAGALATLEIADYHAEHGRFAADELGPLHALFEADSDAAAALCADPELDRIAALVLAFDALAAGLGLELPARHDLARARRRAAEGWTPVDLESRRAADAGFRAHGRALRAWLQNPEAVTAGRGALAAQRARLAEAARGLTESARARLLPTLLHLSAVRLVGADADAERLGYTFWERTLDGLRAR